MAQRSATQPRPLAVREMYSGRHNQARFHRPSDPDRSSPDYFAHTAAHFKIGDQRPPAGIFEKTERTRELYTELEADLSFLDQMRDIWETKLAQLKVEFDMLQEMAQIRPEDVDELIDPEESTVPVAAAQPAQPAMPSVMPPDTGSRELVGYGGEMHNLYADSSSSTDQQLMSLLSGGDPGSVLFDSNAIPDSDVPKEEEEDGDDEMDDDERARQALTLMLAEYGDEL